MTLDPGLSDDLPFADAGPSADADANEQPSAVAVPEQGAPKEAARAPLSDDADGILPAQESIDAGQAGNLLEPPQGPATGPKEEDAADAGARAP